MHKLTTKIAGELSEVESEAILEDLKAIKGRILRRSKRPKPKTLKVERQNISIHTRIQAEVARTTSQIRQSKIFL